jgi:RHS repeat-associated protein
MRKVFFSVFFLIHCVLFSNPVAVIENDPNTIVDGVSVITGDFYAQCDDVVVQGYEPIRLHRSYVSQKGEGIWNFFQYHRALLRVGNKWNKGKLLLVEPNGSLLVYNWKEKKGRFTFTFNDLETDKNGMTNTARGPISARTNLKNQRIAMEKSEKTFTVYAPDGSRRVYHRIKEKSTAFETPYQLIEEILPNGNMILYEWPKHDGDVWQIKTCDAGRSTTYAWIRFYPKTSKRDRSPYDYGVETSDGRHFEFKFFFHKGTYQLREVESDENPTETIHYFDCDEKKLVNAFTWPEGRARYINYYQRGKNKNPRVTVHKKDDRFLRVRELGAPVGTTNHNYMTHQFVYNLKKKKTTVFNAYKIPTNYYWNDELRLTDIERYSDKDTFYNQSKFIWGEKNSAEEGHLLCKILLSEEKKPIQAVRYFYDPFGNIREERLYGNLSGEGGAIELASNGFPEEGTTECYKKRYYYTQDGRHLLLRMEEDNGYAVEYSYYKDYALVSEERTFDQGELIEHKTYRYGKHRVLLGEVIEDIRNKTRFIKEITPFGGDGSNPNSYPGMPHIIEEKKKDRNGTTLVKKTVFQYGSGGRIIQKSTYGGDDQYRYEEKYEYTRGKLSKEIDPYGYYSETIYDALGNKKQYRPIGQKTTLYFDYDLANRPIRLCEVGLGLERTATHEYNLLGQTTCSTDEFGNKTHFFYDAQGHVTETHLPLGDGKSAKVQDFYDAADNIVTHIDGEGKEIKTSYTIRGKPITITHSDGSQECFRYHLDGTLKWHKGSDGIEEEYTYDSLQRVLTKTHVLSGELLEENTYNARNITSAKDAEGRITTYSYDGAGRLIKEKRGEEVICYEYDVLGRQEKIVLADLIVTKKQDFLGQVIEEKKEYGYGDLIERTRFEYSPERDQIAIYKEIQGSPAKESFVYDGFHRLIERIDPLGCSTYYQYENGLNQKITIDAMGLQTLERFTPKKSISYRQKKVSHGDVLLEEFYSYDQEEHLLSCDRIFGKTVQSLRYDYDDMYHIMRMTEAAGSKEESITSYTYTSEGRLLEEIKPNGISLSYSYDPFGYLKSLISSDGSISYRYIHDKTGLLLVSKDELSEETLLRSYDQHKRLTEEVFPNKLTMKYGYDKQGRLSKLTLPDSSFIEYKWKGHLMEGISRCTVEGFCSYSHLYEKRDLSGNILQETLPFHLGQITNGYDLLGRRVATLSSHFAQDRCVFDKVGNLLRTTRNGESLSYAYSELYQLIYEKDHSYDYDPLYNRVRKDRQSYEINELNQTSALSYDAAGNPTYYNGKKLSYDALDRLVLVEDDTCKVYYTYDSLHRRMSKKTCFGQKTIAQNYLYEGQNEIGSYDEALHCVELRVLGQTPFGEIGASIALELQGKIYIPFHDLHGNVAALYSPSTHELEIYSYTAFGEELFSPSSNPWRFSSKRIDEETGLTYFGRRYYCADLGRWLTKDPLGQEAGPNLYAFVSNAPLTHLDAYGLLMEDFVSSAQLHQAFVYDVESEGVENTPNTKHVYFVNGMNTSFKKARSYATSLFDYNKDIKVKGVYNTRDGWIWDLTKAVMNIMGAPTDASELLHKECTNFFSNYTGGERLFLVGHSAGAGVVKEVIERLPTESQKRCVIITIAPSVVIPKKPHIMANNYASEGDLVPWLASYRNYPQSRDEYKQLHRVPTHPNGTRIDHTFISPNFAEVLREHLNQCYSEPTCAEHERIKEAG